MSPCYQEVKLTCTDNTVGVAIWTTVEIGIGITAGCAATLRPLLRMAFDRFGIGSSSNRKYQPSGQANSRSRITPGAHPLDEFAPGHGVTTTTITGNRVRVEKNRSRSSSQEQFASPVDKITKHFVIEYDDESSEDAQQDSRESRERRWIALPRRR